MQEITQLPETVYIGIKKDGGFTKMGGTILTIENHKVTSMYGLFCWLFEKDGPSLKTKIMELRENKISYEAFIENSVMELEDEVNLRGILIWDFNVTKNMGDLMKYAKSAACMEMAEKIIDKIRDCKDWDDLNLEMGHDGRFMKRIRIQITEEMNKIYSDSQNRGTTPRKKVNRQKNRKNKSHVDIV